MIKKQNFCNKSYIWKQIGVGIIIFISVLAIMALFSASARGEGEDEIVLNFSFPEPIMTEINISNITHHNVSMNGSIIIGDQGLPMLPVKPMRVLLPQNSTFDSLNITYNGNTSMGNSYNVTLGGELNDSNVSYFYSRFNSSIPYPTRGYSEPIIQNFRGYSILFFNLNPVYYIGETGEIYYYNNMTVTIKTNNSGSVSPLFRGLLKDEILMKQKVDDYSMDYTYATGQPQTSRDYVIITSSSLANSAAPTTDTRDWYTFQNLTDHKGTDHAYIKTVEEIYNQYEGDDNQEKIRNFIKLKAYPEGVDYVLLGGDTDIVPARYLWCSGGNDYDELPSDLYYSCLDGTYNSSHPDEDHWGQPEDGESYNCDYGPDCTRTYQPLGSGIFYVEAERKETNVMYDVGLFTPSLDFSQVPSGRKCWLNFSYLFKKFVGNEDYINVTVYSGGIPVKTLYEDYTGDGLPRWGITPGENSIMFIPSESEYTDKNHINFEFYYKCGTSGVSYNIDDVRIFWEDDWVEEIQRYTTYKEVFWDSFEEKNWKVDEDWDPEDNSKGWTQTRYNENEKPGSWELQEYKDDLDLMAEVYVGRASVGNAQEVSNFVYKTLDYDEAKENDPVLMKALMVGLKMNYDILADGSYEKEEIRNGCSEGGYITKGIPQGYFVDCLYDMYWMDQNNSYGSPYNKDGWPRWVLKNKINKDGVSIINLASHGVQDSILRYVILEGSPDHELRRIFENVHVDSLSNNKFFFIYSGACLLGEFDWGGSWWPSENFKLKYYSDCFAERLTVGPHGAFAAVMNTREGFEGLSQVFDRQFFDALFGENILELGKANQDSKEDNLNYLNEGFSKYNRQIYYELTLFGDPQLSIKIPEVNHRPDTPEPPTIDSEFLFGDYTYYTFTTSAHDSDDDQVSFQIRYCKEDTDEDYNYSKWTKYYNSDATASVKIWIPCGKYDVSVRARDKFNWECWGWSEPITVTASFNSNIQMDSSTVVIGEEIQFSGQASEGTQPYYTWYWDFGDGNYSNQQNTSHIYSNLGTYNVTLNVTDSQNITSNATKVVSVVILKSDIECSPSCGTLDETINFNDVSNGYHTLVNWSWDFDDGNISYNMNPSHQYTAEGVYNVSLMVTDTESNNNISYQTIYIDSGDPVVTSCSSDLDEVGYGYNVTITTNVSDSISGVKNVTVNITYPDDTYGNFTMNNINGNTYEYVFDDTYQLGDYSYKIWVVDHAENNNCSTQKNLKVIRNFGYQKVGNSNQSIWETITGSRFIINLTGVADNISVYIDPGNVTSDYHYQCMIYRHNDSTLIGVSEEKNVTSGKGWKKFDFTVPKPVLMNDTEYVLCCWSDNYTVRMYYDNANEEEWFYDDGNSTLQGHYFRGVYNYAPDINNFDHEDRRYSIYCRYTPDNTKPVITNVSDNPDTVGFGFNVTITADISDNQSGVETVTVNITYPDSTTGNFTMNNIGNDTYQYVFSNTWLVGQYNYTIWTVDYISLGNSSSGHSFNVSAQATISVCTIKDEYGNNETINLTDPPGDPSLIGYELLDDGEVLRIWNNYDSYYFNTSSGIQLTNHYNKYWSHNVLMLGYYNNNQWNLIYRTDELSGFNKNIESDNETYVNATLWKDLSYLGYDFRLAIRYYLGVDDKELTVIPYIKNLGLAIPYTLGFAWELKDIQVDMTPCGDYIEINGTTYLLNQSLDETYKNLSMSCFYIREDISCDRSESLYLCWNDSLDYFVKVKSREDQYNAPVILGIKIGTLGVGQEKYTSLLWHDASEIMYYFNSYNTGEAWSTNPGYMVDGSTSTYSSTASNGDVELCNGNTCPGLNLGNIIKVELRVHGKYTGTQRDIRLRPVFGGTTDGMNYDYRTTTTPSWSPWFDITTDPSAPPWSWTKVNNLDCDVEAKSGFGSFTLYCSKVEIRVTYIPNNNIPVISDPYPADGSTGISIAPVLDITVVDPDGNIMNITWLSNSSGSWVAFGYNNSVSNGIYHKTMSNASTNGKWWYWKVNVTDGINCTESSVYKFYTGYQSKINNTGSYHFKGYLLIQVQYYNETSQSWVVADDTINESSPRTILWADPGGTPGQNILALDTIFNGLVSTSDLSWYGNGTYRVYACFRDPYGDVLVCDDDSLMEATYEFTVNI